MKNALISLDSISGVHVSRSEPTKVGGFTWTISFIEDSVGTHRGDLQDIEVSSHLSTSTYASPSLKVQELRKGTFKEVQRIKVLAGGDSVNPFSSFQLRFNGESTREILALPIDGRTCLGATASKQLITTSTENTIDEGGDNAVSPRTTFVIKYKDFETYPIHANNGDCDSTASIIAHALMELPPLYRVNVTGLDSNNTEHGGCIWTVTLLDVYGNPELFQGTFRQSYW